MEMRGEVVGGWRITAKAGWSVSPLGRRVETFFTSPPVLALALAHALPEEGAEPVPEAPALALPALSPPAPFSFTASSFSSSSSGSWKSNGGAIAASASSFTPSMTLSNTLASTSTSPSPTALLLPPLAPVPWMSRRCAPRKPGEARPLAPICNGCRFDTIEPRATGKPLPLGVEAT